VKPFPSRNGAALITVTAIIVVSSLVLAAVYYFLHRGIEVSGLQKRYQVAREASLGGIDVFTKDILPLSISGTTLSSVLGGFNAITNAQVQQVATNSCFSDKLLKSTAGWATGCDSAIDANTNPDIRFTLSGTAPAQPFSVRTKIVDTVVGNSSTSGVVLEGQGTAETQTGMIATQHFPYLYRMEVQGEMQNNPTEKARFSVLYAY
jgi:hypothetical protein